MPGTRSRAERVVRFVNSLPCTAGPLAGKPLKLRPWQVRFIRAIYKTDKAGNRLVRTAVLSVARKNGKTQLAAALCLCALSGPEAEPRGECYAVAALASRPVGSSTKWSLLSRRRPGPLSLPCSRSRAGEPFLAQRRGRSDLAAKWPTGWPVQRAAASVA
jgi:hypothetical protein